MPEHKTDVKPELSLAGETVRWTFENGPTAGKTYEHSFHKDGTVTYREVGGDDKADDKKSAAKKSPDAQAKSKTASTEKKTPTKYASFEIGGGMHLVSYLSEMGYTLTVLVNMDDDTLHGFVSNDKEWMPLTGTQEQGG